MNSDDIVNEDFSDPLRACSVCERTFLPSALVRHERICKNASIKQRKVFDSFQQRAKGNGTHKVIAEQEEINKPKRRWKKQHEELLQIIRADKEIDKTVNESNPSHSLKKYISLAYTQCPVCGRHFNQKAADRHITWCQEQKSRLPKTPANSLATERLKARINYHAPLPAKNKTKGSVERKCLSKPSRPCQSASIIRSHSSPSPLNESLWCHKFSEDNGMLNWKNDQKQSPRKNTQEINYIKDRVTIPSYKSSSPHLNEAQAVKFKEKFSHYNALSDNSDDLLNMLRMKLADIGHYEDVTERFNLRRSEITHGKICTQVLPEVSSSEVPQFMGKDLWNSDGDVHRSASSSSDGSFPSLSRVSSSQDRMPRFCYQCGTKYPIASAKYCCECGAQRLVFAVSNVA